MATKIHTLALADATLSDGAVLAAAGGGLPQRVGPPNELRWSIGGNGSAVAWVLSDDRILGAAQGALLTLFDASGASVEAVSGTDCGQGMGVDEALGEVYIRKDNTVEVRDLANLTTVIRTWPNPVNATITTGTALGFAGTDKIWAMDFNGFNSSPPTEYDRFGIATGRSVPHIGGSAQHRLAISDTHVFIANNYSSIQKLRISDGEYTPISGTGSSCGGIWHDAAPGILYARRSANGTLGGLYLRAFREDLTEVTPRLQVIGDRQGQSGFTPTTTPGHQGSAVHANSRFMVISDLHNPNSLLRLDRRTARAEWTKPFAIAHRLDRIIVPGALGNTQDASFDDRKTRCYYSTNGVDITEFWPGDYLGVSLAAGVTLTVRIDMNTWAKPDATPPWIGESGSKAGQGVVLVVDDLLTPNTSKVVVSPPRSSIARARR